MASVGFSVGEWERIWHCLKDHPGIYVVQEAPTRRFLETIFGCTAPWRLSPAEFGPWNCAYKRFARWQEEGVSQMPMDRLAADGDLEWLMLDSTIARSSAAIHPQSGRRQQTPAGWAPTPTLPGKKSEGEQRLGRSPGGWSSKLHGLGDSLGNPLRFVLTADRSGDASGPIPLLDAVSMITVQAVLADRAHDSDAILARIREHGTVPVIPLHPSRATTRETDWCLYKERARITRSAPGSSVRSARRSSSVASSAASTSSPGTIAHLVAACIACVVVAQRLTYLPIARPSSSMAALYHQMPGLNR